jgi:6-phosphogluconolactonase
MKPDIHSIEDPDAMFGEAARLISLWSGEAMKRRGRFTLVLSGGNTPRPLYSLLSGADYRGKIDWGRVHLFWGDERFVPRDSHLSNYRMAFETLISSIPIPEENVHPVPDSEEAQTPDEAARDYEKTIRSFFAQGGKTAGRFSSREPDSGIVPEFDAVILGMGADGHTASLFPRSNAISESERLVVAVEAPSSSPVRERITFTLPLLNRASRIMFLVSGKGKELILKTVLSEMSSGAPSHPAGMVKPAGRLVLMTDIAVAGL